MMTIAACLWMGLFPLLQGGTYARITLDKWICMCVLCAATLCLFIPEALLRREARRAGAGTGLPARGRTSLLPLVFAGVLLLCCVLSCLLGPFRADSWWLGASVRREGLLTQLCYLGLFFLFAFSKVNLKPVLFSAAAGVAVFSVIVLLQRAGGNPLGLYPAGRSYELNPEFQGTIGNVDMGTGWLCMLAGFFAFGGLNTWRSYRSRCGSSTRHSIFPSSVISTERRFCTPGKQASVLVFSKERAAAPYTKWRRDPRQISDLVTVIASGIGLLLSVFLIVTMGVQFGMITLAVLLGVSLLCFVPRKWRLPLCLLLLVIVLLAVWFWPGTGGGVWELHEILHGRSRLSFGSNRVAVWTYSMPLAKESLLLGSGSDTFVVRFNTHLQKNGLVIPNEQDGVPLPDYFDAPHNEYLAQWLNHGLPAMLAFILLLALAVWKKRDGLLPLLTPCSAAVLCYAVQAFFSFSVCIVAPVFWVLLGISRKEVE